GRGILWVLRDRVRWHASRAFVLLVTALVGCTTTPASVGQSTAPRDTGQADRPLVILVGVEPATVATRGFVQKGAGLHVALRIFNALPTLIDARGQPQPELL